jgi:hypothetical protein
VIEFRESLRFLAEAFCEGGIVDPFRGQEFQGDETVE